ncbi:MAG TPA: hypothetical protein VFD13_08115 [Candidatus Kapabacteria bacterium]|nr:hypothetical protein [Candidatus Kapabacteria bacterium]
MKSVATEFRVSSRAIRVAAGIAACALFFSALQAAEAFGQWKQSTGYHTGSMYGFFGVSFAGSNYLLVSVQVTSGPPAPNDSLYYSTDHGQSWLPFGPNGGLPLATVFHSGVPNIVGRASFPAHDGSITGILAYSTDLLDHFQTWTPDTLGFPTSQPTNDPLASALVTMGTGTTIYAADGAYGIYQQTAPGAKWTADTVGMTRNDTPYSVAAMIVFGSNLYANTYGGGMMVSTNQGASWSSANGGLTSPIPGVYLGPGGASFAISGTSLFAMIPNNGYGFDTLYNFYRLGSDGTSWTRMNSTPLKGGVGVITNFTASSKLLFAAHDSTVNFSNDNGATWHQGNQGLPNFAGVFAGITSVTVSGSNLVIGILGGFNQIWYRPLSEFVSSLVTPSTATDAGLHFALSGNHASGSEVVTIDPLTLASGTYFASKRAA